MYNGQSDSIRTISVVKLRLGWLVGRFKNSSNYFFYILTKEENKKRQILTKKYHLICSLL
jgi:hypothetical protein